MEKILNKEEIKCSTCGGGRDDNPFCSNGFHVTPKEKIKKILIIDKCWDCNYFTDDPPHCWEPNRNKKILNADIADAMIIDPGCQLPDAPEPITELISVEELEDILDGKQDVEEPNKICDTSCEIFKTDHSCGDNCQRENNKE